MKPTDFEQSIKPTIKANYIGNILQAYNSKGMDGDALLAEIGLQPLANIKNTRISVSQFIMLTESIQRALNDEMLGYLTLPVPKGSMDLISQTMVTLPTLGDALRFYNRFLALFNDGAQPIKMEEKGSKLRLSLQFESSLQASSPYYMQRMLLTSYKSLCWLSKTKIALKEVSFAFPLKNDAAELAYVFDCKDIVERDESYIEFKENVFDLPITQSVNEVDEFSKNFAIYTLLWPRLEGLESKIRGIIGIDLSEGFPSFNDVAEGLGVSSQTLSRRLQDAGLTYQQIKDDIRRDAAIALLAGGERSIKEVAYAVGFKESSSFSKAFKQWAGVSPSEYTSNIR